MAVLQLQYLEVGLNKITGTLPQLWSSMAQASTTTLGFMPEICIHEFHAPVLKQDKVMLQLQQLGMASNQLEGGLPESWSNLTSVSFQH